MQLVKERTRSPFEDAQPSGDWADTVFDVLHAGQIHQVAIVPDAGHSRLIRRCEAAAEMKVVRLTTEEEGVALLAGAWLGGERGVLLMQSSGVGNCINMLSLPNACQMPLLMLITMRGDWGEFNPWQVYMGAATQTVLEAMNVVVRRADHEADVTPTVQAALDIAYFTNRPAAVLIGQRVIGAKNFKELTK